MASASTPARNFRASQAADAFSSRTASPQLDQTVRYPPPDALRLFSSGKRRDRFPLTAIARQIDAARAPTSAPSPSPTRTHSSRSSNRAEPAGEALLQTLARFADQLAAQSAAQSAAQLSVLSTIMQRFDTLHPARPPSQAASPTSPHASHRQSALDVRAPAGVPLSSYSQSIARPLPLNPRATAHVPLSAPQQAHQWATAPRDASLVQLGAVQQSHLLAPPPLARVALASPISLVPPVPLVSCVARIARIARIARVPRVARAVTECRREPTIGASSRAARSPVALSRCSLRIYSTFHSIRRARCTSRVLCWCRLFHSLAPHRRCTLLRCLLRRSTQRVPSLRRTSSRLPLCSQLLMSERQPLRALSLLVFSERSSRHALSLPLLLECSTRRALSSRPKSERRSPRALNPSKLERRS